ncbi:MAG: MBL fold metallo-hydrolase, partial [Pseudorhodoplanes sp.]
MGMAVATKLNALVTGELAGHRCVLINTTQSAEYLSERGMLPFGYRPRITLSDGSIMDGVLKPVHIWYIETPDARIVVDTSFESAAAVHKTQTGRGQPMFLHRKEEWEIPAALASVGVQPEDIDIVILSHCHYDH